MSYGIRLQVSGARALFTRPEMKVERVSYDVMTPSAARGILEAIHWKPAIRWIVQAIHVLRPIEFRSLRRNEVGAKAPVGKLRSAIKSGSLDGVALVVEENRQQRAATILHDVAYVIEARLELTGKAGAEDNPSKHLEMFSRRARKGQCFHQPCLGTREFPARFELLDTDAALPEAIAVDRRLGFMLYDIDFANNRQPIFFDAELRAGILHVPAPDAAELRR